MPENLLIDVDQKLLDLRKAGTRVSFSSLVEVALKELLRINNVASVLKRNGATSRRMVSSGGKYLDGNGKLDGKAKDSKTVLERVGRR